MITNAKSKKMEHIKKDPVAAICGDWFTGHGAGENLGHVRREENEEIAGKLRAVFQEWYDNGHVDEVSFGHGNGKIPGAVLAVPLIDLQLHRLIGQLLIVVLFAQMPQKRSASGIWR